jgi:hypothetical protein
LLDVVIDDDIVVFLPVLDLVASAEHPAPHDVGRVLGALIEAPLECGRGRRQYKDGHYVVLGLGAQRCRPLPIDIE